jgi:hypothetical protein
MKMEQTECSETLAYKIQMSVKHPEENTQQGMLFRFGRCYFPPLIIIITQQKGKRANQ